MLNLIQILFPTPEIWKQLKANQKGRKATLILDDLFSRSCWRQQNNSDNLCIM